MPIERTPVVLLGASPDQPGVVVATAARFAAQFDAELVCAYVNPARYRVEELPDGTVVSLPIDPDVADEELEQVDPELRARLSEHLTGTGVVWSIRALAGAPAQELQIVADRLEALMIVVGARKRGFGGTLREFLNGSVGAQLAHCQPRPVVVVPVTPTDPGKLPWERGE